MIEAWSRYLESEPARRCLAGALEMTLGGPTAREVVQTAAGTESRSSTEQARAERVLGWLPAR